MQALLARRPCSVLSYFWNGYVNQSKQSAVDTTEHEGCGTDILPLATFMITALWCFMHVSKILLGQIPAEINSGSKLSHISWNAKLVYHSN